MSARKAALYARTSKKKTHDPWASIPQQVEALRGLAGRWGCEVVVEFREEMTAARSDRPLYTQMMDLIREGAVDTILVVRFDRLTRTESLGEFEDVKRELRRLKCELITYDMGRIELDGGANAEFTTDVLAAAAKAERLKIRERTKAGREAKALSGRFYGYVLPFGYKAKYDEAGNKTIIEDPDTAPWAQRIFEWYAGGESLSGIQERLEAAGIPSPQGKDLWTRLSIRRILDNTNYIGLLAFGKSTQAPPTLVSTEDIPPLIDEATWKAVQARRSLDAFRNHRGPNKPYPLTGILRCSACGFKMMTSHNHVTGLSYYRCSAAKEKRAECPAPESFSAKSAHALVHQLLVDELPRYVSGLDTPSKAAALPVDPLAGERRKLEELERERTAIIRRAASLDDDEILAALRPIREEIAAQKAHIQELASRPAQQAPDRAALAPLIAELAHIDPGSLSDLRDLFAASLRLVHLRKVGRLHRNQHILGVMHVELITGEALSASRE